MQHIPFHLSPDEFNRFLTFGRHLMQRQHWCLVRVMVATGMRLSEALSLTPASVLNGSMGKVRVSSPHAKPVRMVQICPKLACVLQAYLTQYPTVTAAACTKDPIVKPVDPTSGAPKQ